MYSSLLIQALLMHSAGLEKNETYSEYGGSTVFITVRPRIPARIG
jgi:hypothetical protein